jgi:hypothetical protein
LVGSCYRPQAWYAEFLLEIIHKILLRKTGVKLIFKIALMSLHIDPVELQADPPTVLLYHFFTVLHI